MSLFRFLQRPIAPVAKRTDQSIGCATIQAGRAGPDLSGRAASHASSPLRIKTIGGRRSVFGRLAGTTFAGLLIPGALLMAADSHPFTVHDLVALDRVSDPRVSPNGQQVVFAVSSLDLEANKRRTHLWLVGTDGSGLRQLTRHQASDSGARWAPDGQHIYFLSSRSSSQQIWRIAADGGEAEPVAKLPLDVGSFRLSPDGTRLALSLEVFPNETTLEATQKRLEAIKNQKATGRVYDSLLFRHWDAWSDGRRSHLFVMALSGGKPIDVMNGVDADAPSKPFGGDEEYTFTPDGQALVFTAKTAGPAEAWSTDFDLWLAPIDGSAVPRKLTTNPACDSTPVFATDGKTLAYLAMQRPGFESDRFRIVLRPWPEGPDRILTEGWDRSPASLDWSDTGQELYVKADNVGQESLFAIDVSTATVRTVLESGTIRSPQALKDRIVFGKDTLTEPTDLYSIRPDGTDLRRLTDFNRSKMASARLGQPEQFSFDGWNGERVYAYCVRPIDFDPQRKYPVAFLIHGGPQGSFGNDFHYRWNAQTYAAAGYAVVMVDFHGSTGYGQAFTDAIRGDWGGKPLEDLQRGLAAALQRYSFLDGDRVAALGASYGAYMVNWIEGKWPDRFRCLVSHDGNLDERAAYYMTDELWFPEWEHEGTPWDNPKSYEKQNPQSLVKFWRTPILVVHGGQDFRIAESQGMAAFTAAQRRGIPSKLLYFPDESHWVLQPQNSILWHETVLAWLNRWTQPR